MEYKKLLTYRDEIFRHNHVVSFLKEREDIHVHVQDGMYGNKLGHVFTLDLNYRRLHRYYECSPSEPHCRCICKCLWDPLWAYSCFPFEGMNHILKLLFHGTHDMS